MNTGSLGVARDDVLIIFRYLVRYLVRSGEILIALSVAWGKGEVV